MTEIFLLKRLPLW